MDKELLQNLGLLDENIFQGIEYIQNYIALYEQILKAMGLIPSELLTSEVVDNSQIVYAKPQDEDRYYAYI